MMNVTFRYALQTLTPAKVIADVNGHLSITKDDVLSIDDLFFDSKKSAQLLSDQEARFLL